MAQVGAEHGRIVVGCLDVLQGVEEFAGVVVSFGGVFCACPRDDGFDGGAAHGGGELDGS